MKDFVKHQWKKLNEQQKMVAVVIACIVVLVVAFS
jgi:flagellar biosynthesis/type III secretory pathway M-ring protein FliF/YscJ